MNTNIDFTVNYYELLGIEKTAKCAVVKDAYRKQALKLHPDKIKDPELLEKAPEIFAKIEAAKKLLCNPCERSKYDAEFNKNFSKPAEKESSPLNKEENIPSDEYQADLAEIIRHYQKESGKIYEGAAAPQEAYKEDKAPIFHLLISGNKPLHVALIKGNLGEAKTIIEECSDDNNAENSYGYTPLHYASLYGYSEMVELLLEVGAIISHNKFGENALHNALKGGHVKSAIVLLKKEGIDIFNVADNSGMTPSRLAQELCKVQSEECTELLALIGDEILADDKSVSVVPTYDTKPEVIIGQIATLEQLTEEMKRDINEQLVKFKQIKSDTTSLDYIESSMMNNTTIELVEENNIAPLERAERLISDEDESSYYSYVNTLEEAKKFVASEDSNTVNTQYMSLISICYDFNGCKLLQYEILDFLEGHGAKCIQNKNTDFGWYQTLIGNYQYTNPQSKKHIRELCPDIDFTHVEKGFYWAKSLNEAKAMVENGNQYVLSQAFSSVLAECHGICRGENQVMKYLSENGAECLPFLGTYLHYEGVRLACPNLLSGEDAAIV